MMMMIIRRLRICRNLRLLIMRIKINKWIKLMIRLDQWLGRIHNMMFRWQKILCISITRGRSIRNLCRLVVRDVLIEKIRNHLFLAHVRQNLNQLLQISIMKHLKKSLPLVFFQIQFAFLKLNWTVKTLKKYEFTTETSQQKSLTNSQTNLICLITLSIDY